MFINNKKAPPGHLHLQKIEIFCIKHILLCYVCVSTLFTFYRKWRQKHMWYTCLKHLPLNWNKLFSWLGKVKIWTITVYINPKKADLFFSELILSVQNIFFCVRRPWPRVLFIAALFSLIIAIEIVLNSFVTMEIIYLWYTNAYLWYGPVNLYLWLVFCTLGLGDFFGNHSFSWSTSTQVFAK